MLIKDGHLQLVDVSGLEIRPSSWRQAVDLANMLLTLALRTDADRVYARATAFFTPDEIAEAFASDVGLAVPTELASKLKADGRPLRERFKELAPSRPPISIQRWSTRRLALTASAVVGCLRPRRACSWMPSAPGSPSASRTRCCRQRGSRSRCSDSRPRPKGGPAWPRLP